MPGFINPDKGPSKEYRGAVTALTGLQGTEGKADIAQDRINEFNEAEMMRKARENQEKIDRFRGLVAVSETAAAIVDKA